MRQEQSGIATVREQAAHDRLRRLVLVCFMLIVLETPLRGQTQAPLSKSQTPQQPTAQTSPQDSQSQQPSSRGASPPTSRYKPLRDEEDWSYLRDSSRRARYIGTQPSVQVQWQVDAHTSLNVIYTRFASGKFLREMPPSRSVNYFTAWMQYRF